MPYDPSKPADLTPIDAGEMRGQLTGLFDLIQAVPAGPPGPPGPPGPGTVASVSGGVVDNTDPANPVIRTDVADGVPKLVEGPSDGINRFLGKDVSASSFNDQSGTGGQGNAALVDGDFFTPGVDGAGEGPGNLFIVDLGEGNEAAIQVLTITESWHGGPDVSTDATCDFRHSDDGSTWVVVGSFVLPAGSGSQVTLEFDFPNRGAHRWWSFIVTAGGPGSMMLREVQGFCKIPPLVPEGRIAPEIARVAAMNAGDAAVQAATAADATAKADAVLAASSNNTNAVATLDTPFANDPPTLADMELMRAKFNELVLGLRRS
jgi:hypothetical protein